MTVLCGCVYVCRIQHGEVLHGVNFSSNFWRFSSMAARFRDLTKCYILMWHFCLRAYLQSFAHTHTEFQIAGCLDMSDCEKLYQSLFPTELFLLFRFVQEDIGLTMINLWLFLLSNPLPSCWYPALQISKKVCIGYAFSSCSKSMFLSTWGTKRPGSALWKEESCSSCVMQLIMSNIATYAKSQTCNYCEIVTIEILEHGNGDWASMNYAGTITEMLSGFSHAGCWHATGRLRNIQDDRQGNRQALLALEMCWRR